MKTVIKKAHDRYEAKKDEYRNACVQLQSFTGNGQQGANQREVFQPPWIDLVLPLKSQVPHSIFPANETQLDLRIFSLYIPARVWECHT